MDWDTFNDRWIDRRIERWEREDRCSLRWNIIGGILIAALTFLITWGVMS